MLCYPWMTLSCAWQSMTIPSTNESALPTLSMGPSCTLLAGGCTWSWGGQRHKRSILEMQLKLLKERAMG